MTAAAANDPAPAQATTPAPAPAQVPAPAKPGLVEFVRFLATGSIAALANLAAVWAFQLVAPYPLAVLLGYLVGMLLAFILFQRLMFNTPGLILTRPILARRILRFTLVNLLGMALAWGVSVSLFYLILPAIHWTFIPDRIANLIGVAIPAFSSYFGHKFWTYR